MLVSLVRKDPKEKGTEENDIDAMLGDYMVYRGIYICKLRCMLATAAKETDPSDEHHFVVFRVYGLPHSICANGKIPPENHLEITVPVDCTLVTNLQKKQQFHLFYC